MPAASVQGSHHRDWFVGVAEDFQRAAQSAAAGAIWMKRCCAHGC